MDKFNKDNPSSCPQCGGSGEFGYHAEAYVGCGQLGRDGEGPHMHRTCGTCKYQWAEQPAV